MTEAHRVLQQADVDYQCALAIGMDTLANADGAPSLRRKGRAYANAVTEYSNAAMAWLIYVDSQLHHQKMKA